MMYTHLTVEHSFDNRIAKVTLRRPDVHNAFNVQMIQDLITAFSDLATDNRLHGVILTGEGPSFSAGADISMMKEVATFTEEQNLADALSLSDLLYLINTLPCPVVARVNGAAIGGGVGLVAACDIAIAAETARFAFSEVKLGIAPAVISPFVIHKIGEAQARRFFVTGERFGAAQALTIGLIHTIVPPEQLDEAIQKIVRELLSSAPQAIRASKALALQVSGMRYDQARTYTAKLIATLRASAEGQEGLGAFLEKRKPSWVTEQQQ